MLSKNEAIAVATSEFAEYDYDVRPGVVKIRERDGKVIHTIEYADPVQLGLDFEPPFNFRPEPQDGFC